jgi:hypothetical protein
VQATGLRIGARPQPLAFAAPTCSTCFIRLRSGDFSEQLKQQHSSRIAGPAITPDLGFDYGNSIVRGCGPAKANGMTRLERAVLEGRPYHCPLGRRADWLLDRSRSRRASKA